MRLHDTCPACRRDIRWYHLFASPLAPVYFHCIRCKAKLRLAKSRYVVVTWIGSVGCALLFLGLIVVLPLSAFLWKLIAAALIALAALIVMATIYPLQGGKIRVREPSVVADAHAHRYLRTLLILLAVTVVVVLPLAYYFGVTVGWYEAARSQEKRPLR